MYSRSEHRAGVCGCDAGGRKHGGGDEGRGDGGRLEGGSRRGGWMGFCDT